MVTKTEAKSKKTTKTKIDKTSLVKKVKTIIKPENTQESTINNELPKKSILKVKTKPSLAPQPQIEQKTKPKSSKKVQISLENNIVKEFNKKNQIGVSETILSKSNPISKPVPTPVPTPTPIELKTQQILKDTVGGLIEVDEKQTVPPPKPPTSKQSKKNNKKSKTEENLVEEIKQVEEKKEEIPQPITIETKKSNKKQEKNIEKVEEKKPEVVVEDKKQPKNKKKTNEKEENKKVEEKPIEKIEKKSIEKSKNKPEVVEDKKEEKKLEVVEEKKVIVEKSNGKNKKEEETSKLKSNYAIINGFTVVPVSLENTTLKKYIYVKKETNKKWPRDRTLFVCNLPNHCTTLEEVKIYFKNDNIESVQFSKTEKEEEQPQQDDDDLMDIDPTETQTQTQTIMDTGVAHLVFKESDNLNSFIKKSINLLTQYEPTSNGFDKMLENYQAQDITDYDNLQYKLDKIMMDYDKKILDQKMNAKKSKGEVDDDGFVLVGASGGKVLTMDEIKAREESKKLKNFYVFQQRQQKKDDLETLRKKFEEDKQKISKMQSTRKFKPY